MTVWGVEMWTTATAQLPTSPHPLRRRRRSAPPPYPLATWTTGCGLVFDEHYWPTFRPSRFIDSTRCGLFFVHQMAYFSIDKNTLPPDGFISFERFSSMARCRYSTKPGRSASAWLANMSGPPSSPIATDWKSGISRRPNRIGACARPMCMTSRRQSRVLDVSSFIPAQIEIVSDVLGLQRNKMRIKKC